MKIDKKLRVTYAKSVYDFKEINAVTRVLKEQRSNIGIETERFEKSISNEFGKKYGVMVNSGSSANLLAFELLDIPEGSEVITPILTFSTTISPLIQKRLKPIFVDVDPETYQIKVSEIEKLINKKTKAIFIPLLLGNIADLKKIKNLCKKYDLYFIEDSCDTIGARFNDIPSGRYSDITTTSFFGSHIITAGGNGGMIMVNNSKWYKRLKLLRGWGRRSSILSETEDIKIRYRSKIEDFYYDGKYIFEEVGYNFLPNEMCAAFGNVQYSKLSKYRKIRESNFIVLNNFFEKYNNFFTLPKQLIEVKTQWLAYPLTIKPSAPFSRFQIVKFLEENNIQTRTIFTGNILRQPGFARLNDGDKNKFVNADHIMKNGFIIGCHHGLEKKHLNKIEAVFEYFLKKYT